MDKITALIILGGFFWAKRLLMTYSSDIPSIIFYLILSFSSGEVSMYYSSCSFLCSSPRFLAKPSVSLGESSD